MPELQSIAGPFLYLAPAWKPIDIRILGGHVDEHGNGYKYDFMNVPVTDLDKDGDLDFVVTGKWGGPVWFENKLK